MSVNQNIVLFTDSFSPLTDATSVLNTTICQSLSQKATVTVVYPRSSKLNSSTISTTPQIRLRAVPVPFVSTRIVPLKLIKFSTYALIILLYLVFQRSKKTTYLVHTSPPLIIPIVSLLLSFKNFFRYYPSRVFLIAHDLYPDILSLREPDDWIKLKFYSFLNYIYLISYRAFDGILCCSESMRDVFLSNYQCKPESVNVVSNWSLYEPPYTPASGSEIAPASLSYSLSSLIAY